MEHDPRARETLAALLVLGCGAQDSVADEEAEKMLRVLASSLGLVVVDAAEHERLRAGDDRRFAEAVDWLLNSGHTADPDIQGPFWAYVDGLISLDELCGESVSLEDIELRGEGAHLHGMLSKED